MLCCWKQHPITPGKALSTKICKGTSHQDGELLCTPKGEGDLLHLHWVPLSCCKLKLLKPVTPGMEHALWKEGRRWGALAWHIPPLVLILKHDMLPPPSDM